MIVASLSSFLAIIGMQIEFTSSVVRFRLRHLAAVRGTIEEIAKDKGFEVGYLHYVFCNTTFILKLNRKYLGHDYSTDIITFPYTEKNLLVSDIYICVPQVERNARELGVPLSDEILRVVFHGVLHLVGYDDHTQLELERMRAAEDRYVSSCKAKINGR